MKSELLASIAKAFSNEQIECGFRDIVACYLIRQQALVFSLMWMRGWDKCLFLIFGGFIDKW